MPRDRVVIVGAGVGGLVSAFALAARGLDVTVLERAATPGGKMRQSRSAPARSTAARPFSRCAGCSTNCSQPPARISPISRPAPLEILARHAWDDAAGWICSLTGPHRRCDRQFRRARGSRRLSHLLPRHQAIYDTLEKPFLRASQPSMGGLIGADGLRGLMQLPQIKPFSRCGRRSRNISAIRGCASCSAATPPIAAPRRSRARRP